jgi:hypothetical protein
MQLGARHEYLHQKGGDVGLVINLVGYQVYARRDQSRVNRDKNALLFDAIALQRDVLVEENVGRSMFYVGQVGWSDCIVSLP